jgi:hypothetical protein
LPECAANGQTFSEVNLARLRLENTLFDLTRGRPYLDRKARSSDGVTNSGMCDNLLFTIVVIHF